MCHRWLVLLAPDLQLQRGCGEGKRGKACGKSFDAILMLMEKYFDDISMLIEEYFDGILMLMEEY